MRVLSIVMDDLYRTTKEMLAAQGRFREANIEAAQLGAELKEKRARRLLEIKASDRKVTNVEAEAEADVTTAALNFKARVAEAVAEAGKMACRAYEAAVSSLQSEAAVIRAEMRMVGPSDEQLHGQGRRRA